MSCLDALDKVQAQREISAHGWLSGGPRRRTAECPPRVLLVDDEPGLRTVQAYFEDEGFIVSTAADGEEGWEGPKAGCPTWC